MQRWKCVCNMSRLGKKGLVFGIDLCRIVSWIDVVSVVLWCTYSREMSKCVYGR